MPDVSVTPLGHDLYLIDAFMHDEEHRLACYLFDTPTRVLIECGPSRSIGRLYDALDAAGVDDLAVMAVTHIHLDHAGGAGHLARRYPRAEIGVHAAGARHLVAPDRLWDSATRIYGEQGMQDLWGPMEPIDEDRLLVLDEGDRIPLGGGRSVEVMYTPGHAKHHIVFFEDETGACFVGDAVGIAFPHGHMVQPVTPPPDFDPHLVDEHLTRIGQRSPTSIGFAHYGVTDDVAGRLGEASDRLWEWVHWVEEAASDDDLTGRMREWVLDGYRAQGVSEEVIAQYDRNTFWPMQATGIQRWLRLRDSPST
jgi:glyoxylase-like metal-dependent hydrolase (beta-lactamase superfamily II)